MNGREPTVCLATDVHAMAHMYTTWSDKACLCRLHVLIYTFQAEWFVLFTLKDACFLRLSTCTRRCMPCYAGCGVPLDHQHGIFLSRSHKRVCLWVMEDGRELMPMVHQAWESMRRGDFLQMAYATVPTLILDRCRTVVAAQLAVIWDKRSLTTHISIAWFALTMLLNFSYYC